MQFHIERMNCGGCAKTITNAILSLDENAKVETDMVSKTVTVDSSAGRGDVGKALAAVGYPATASLGA